jgi:spore coat polysaccharide biosynthesis protein SpsF
LTKAIFITARTASKRLPRKAVVDICGRPAIEYLIDRAKKSRLSDQIILTTTDRPEDRILVEIAKNNSINYFAGDELDKLARWQEAAAKYAVDFFVTADGDDLFCEPELMDLAFEQYMSSNCDFIEEKPGANVPVGAFTYGIKTETLDKICEIKGTSDTEMMSIYFTETPTVKVESLDNIPEIYKRPNIRMTLDYPEDLDFFRSIVSKLLSNGHEVSLRNALSLIAANPHLVKINEFRNKDYLKNQKKRTNYIIKK